MQTRCWKVNPTLPFLFFLPVYFLLSRCFLSSTSLLQFLKAEMALWESDHYWVHTCTTRQTHTHTEFLLCCRRKRGEKNKNAPLGASLSKNEIAGCITSLWRYWKLIFTITPQAGRETSVSILCVSVCVETVFTSCVRQYSILLVSLQLIITVLDAVCCCCSSALLPILVHLHWDNPYLSLSFEL